MAEDASKESDEPVSVATPAADAGSASSGEQNQPELLNDVLRALICAALVGASVGSPASAMLFAPFVPLLVAIRIVRHRGGSRRFLQLATGASLMAALIAVTGAVALSGTEGIALVSAALLAALLLTPVLGIVHARAVRHDPVQVRQAGEGEQDWPEPRIDSGLTLAIIAWAGAAAMLSAAVLPVIGSVSDTQRDVVTRGYSFYVEACEPEGGLADRTEFCASILEQRESMLELVDDHAGELFGALLAIFVFGAAATAHLLALARLRGRSDRIRRAFTLRQLEVHWASAYLVVIGIAAILLVTDDSTAAVILRSIGVALGTLGFLLVASNGLGLVTWVVTRPRVPGWYRAMLIIGSLFVLPVTITVLFGAGVLDQALHPRRRAARSTSSGSSHDGGPGS